MYACSGCSVVFLDPEKFARPKHEQMLPNLGRLRTTSQSEVEPVLIEHVLQLLPDSLSAQDSHQLFVTRPPPLPILNEVYERLGIFAHARIIDSERRLCEISF